MQAALDNIFQHAERAAVRRHAADPIARDEQSEPDVHRTRRRRVRQQRVRRARRHEGGVARRADRSRGAALHRARSGTAEGSDPARRSAWRARSARASPIRTRSCTIFSNLSERVLTAPTVFSFFSPLGDAAGPAESVRAGVPDLSAGARHSARELHLRHSRRLVWRGVQRRPRAVPGGRREPGRAGHQGRSRADVRRMSTDLRQVLITATTAVPASNTRERALGALYLAAISSEYAVAADALGDGLATLVLPPTRRAGALDRHRARSRWQRWRWRRRWWWWRRWWHERRAMPMPPAPPAPPPPPAPSTTAPTNLHGHAPTASCSHCRWQNPIGDRHAVDVAARRERTGHASIPLGVVQSFSYPTRSGRHLHVQRARGHGHGAERAVEPGDAVVPRQRVRGSPSAARRACAPPAGADQSRAIANGTPRHADVARPAAARCRPAMWST